jgi:hypothetical protein
MLPLLEEEKAKQRKATQGRPKKLTQKIESVSDRNEQTAAAEAAAITGTNRQYVADAKQLKEDDPEEFE